MVPGHLLCPNSPSVTHTDARGQSELSLSLRTTGISVKAKLPGGGVIISEGSPLTREPRPAPESSTSAGLTVSTKGVSTLHSRVTSRRQTGLSSLAGAGLLRHQG